jgi:hypothetical protein
VFYSVDVPILYFHYVFYSVDVPILYFHYVFYSVDVPILYFHYVFYSALFCLHKSVQSVIVTVCQLYSGHVESCTRFNAM